jgi:osmoprotectant transport system ATP-binding protein
VDEEGKVAGVVSQEAIGTAIRSAHAGHRDGGGTERDPFTKAGAA